MPGHQRLVRFGYGWIAQVCDPLRAMRAVRGLPRFVADYREYRRRPGAEPLRLLNTVPALHEWGEIHGFDSHYLYVNAWAMRRVLACRPPRHFDVASQTAFVSLLSAVVPVIYVDYRRLEAALDGLRCVQGSILEIPCRDGSVGSVSCLHVAEHIGLGRYGDPLDPAGTKKAAGELSRILAPGGNLYFAVPVGQPRVCFNAHRIHSAMMIREYFSALTLVAYSGVHDDGRFVEHAALDELEADEYGCGMFWFRKPKP